MVGDCYFYPNIHSLLYEQIVVKIVVLIFSKCKCGTKAIMDDLSEGPIACDHVRRPLENELNLR